MSEILPRKIIAVGLALVLAIGPTQIFFDHSPALAANQSVELPVDRDKLVVTTGSGQFAFEIEIADEESERERGLMFRQTMAADHGMLFDFKATETVTMWMRNTAMPLDMVFIRSDGTIARIAERTEPYSEALITSGEAVAFVLELKAGVSRLIGLKAGQRLVHPIFSR